MPEIAEQLYERLLVLRCQTGDELAFAELVDRYHARLRYYVRKMLDQAASADDVLQDVWFDVFRRLPALREPAAFRAWLYRIARDRVFTLSRRAGPQFENLLEHEPSDDADEEEEFSPEDVRRLHEALARLPAEQREVLVLRYLESMTYDDIASVCGAAVGTVRSRLHYAKRAMRHILNKEPCHE